MGRFLFLVLVLWCCEGCYASHELGLPGVRRPTDSTEFVQDAGRVVPPLGSEDSGRHPPPPIPDSGLIPACPMLGPNPHDFGPAELEWLRDAILGRWEGTRESPWDGAPQVTIEFFADSTYRGECLGDCTTFYWGSDGTSPDATYQLQNITDDGRAQGRLTVFFAETGTSWTAPWTDIVMNDAADQLSFQFWDGEMRGPLRFDLRRRCL